MIHLFSWVGTKGAQSAETNIENLVTGALGVVIFLILSLHLTICFTPDYESLSCNVYCTIVLLLLQVQCLHIAALGFVGFHSNPVTSLGSVGTLNFFFFYTGTTSFNISTFLNTTSVGFTEEKTVNIHVTFVKSRCLVDVTGSKVSMGWLVGDHREKATQIAIGYHQVRESGVSKCTTPAAFKQYTLTIHSIK